MFCTTEKRRVCAGQSEACLRCQSAGSRGPGGSVTLLLGAHNANIYQAVIRALDAAGQVYHCFPMVLAVPMRKPYLSDLPTAFFEALADATASEVKAVFFYGNLFNASDALAAFVQADPLAALMERAQYDWVREVLDDNRLFSVFHPIVNADGSGIFAYEALIRAHQPHTGEVIGAWPLLEAAGKLSLEHVLDQRARQSAIRNFSALTDDQRVAQSRLFINFMPNTIYDPEICLRTTMETVAECGLAISDLVFEVVETEHIPNMKRLQVILDYYRSRGAGTAVDDMGAGFSDIDYLTALRPDFMKLDRDLVVRAEHEGSARRTLDTMIAQAKRLGIQVIAEGIETESQWQMCREAGADFLQGFLFARPANPPETVHFPAAALSPRMSRAA